MCKCVSDFVKSYIWPSSLQHPAHFQNGNASAAALSSPYKSRAGPSHLVRRCTVESGCFIFPFSEWACVWESVHFLRRHVSFGIRDVLHIRYPRQIRRRRESAKVARFVVQLLAQKPCVSTQLLDLKRLDLPMMEERLRFRKDTPPAAQEFSAHISRAHAIVIVTPEYNSGYPGVLKNALDLP